MRTWEEVFTPPLLEVVRDQMIDEAAYSEFISDYKETYFQK